MNQPLIRLALPSAPQASQQSFEHAGLTWLVFRDPRQEHVSFLARQYHFHPLHIDDILSRSQRPKIDDNPEQEYVFLQEMKIFTLITVICLPMTLLASIVGMNVSYRTG